MSSRSPSHNKAAPYARSSLFKGLSTFAELERRIELLPTEQERGNAFEVFVEAYLNLDEAAQTDEVWVGGRIPAEIRRELNLPASDYGFDGVFRTRLGELVPYQAKFRTGRASLSYRELATFFGITEKAVRRVVITNSVAIVEVAKSRTNFNATRGTDLDRLDAEQLSRIAAWVDGITPPSRVREPRGYQIAALNDIASEFAAHDRATVVMACGTGKTLVALWAAEKAQAKRVLVLVPSLNLLRQTLHEWAKWTNWGKQFRYLCVCSDSNVAAGLDEIEIHPEDTDFPVQTNPAIVKRFLDTGDSAVSVVFCTYHSAPVIGDALQGIAPFDLGIFDEAHKTTGREGTRFAFALSDKNLPIKKRLFLTATPRHYNIRKRDNDGDFEVASMDNEKQYGRVAHRLTFSQAVAQKIIVPYKVVISVVDSDVISNAILDQSDVVITGDPVRAKWVAQQVALKRAVEAHDARRIITFHSRVTAAAAFASNDSEGIGFHLPAFQRFHVSGKQPTAERDEKMRAFAQVHRGVITNARCLTEGVDVPSVDMVAFMDPRRSRIDIVQAVGRAMRTAGANKTCGYVLVPLFLEIRQGETLDEALLRSDFDEIVQVLNAMRDSDDELSDIIQTLAMDKGKTGGFDESRLSGKIEVLGPRIQLSELAASIRALIVNELGTTWDEWYGKLIAYIETHGNAGIFMNWASNPGLGIWCNSQRMAFKTGRLSLDRVKRLEDIGFVWYPVADQWEQMFASLVEYKQTHGDCNVPIGFSENPKLATWCSNQRGAYKSGKQLPDRIKRLVDIGFVWNPLADAWEKMFAELVEYMQTHGDCNVSARWAENPQLGNWVRVQRERYTARNRNKLQPDRIKRLSDLGFRF
jgi:predicted helicase